MNPEDIITGTVRTDKIGSEVTFDICTRAEWDAMTEDQRNKALREAANESGVFEIYPNT